MSAVISPDEVRHIAKLANLPLEDSDFKTLPKDLSETMDYVDILNELDLSFVEPLTQVTDQINRLREDKVKPSFSQEEALSNAKKTYKGYFMVSHVLERNSDA